jgi:deazaflavin-dependent oxidoreductase (nitroreductase family)
MALHNLPTPNVSPAHAPIEATRAPAFMRPLFKLPLVLYRLRLGWLLGHLFMQLTHTGRRSGKVRRTILVVLRFDARTQEVKAVSAWQASEWYKNIQAAPALQVETGRLRYSPVQRDLSAEEVAQLYVDFRREHPLFSRLVCRIPGWKWDASYDEALALARTLHGVAFRPKQDP